jgi:hypothetical protein
MLENSRQLLTLQVNQKSDDCTDYDGVNPVHVEHGHLGYERADVDEEKQTCAEC